MMKKKSIIEGMHRANREKSGQGSKNENMVRDLLIKRGYNALDRTNEFSPKNQFEIDIPILNKAIAIEWDGIAHFEPIYGEKSLQRVLEKDERKNKALLSNNWTVIRVRDHSTAHSYAFCCRAVEKIIKIIEGGKKGIVHSVDAG